MTHLSSFLGMVYLLHLHIYTENEEIVCTPNHSILTDEGWKLTSELTTDDMIKTSTGFVQVTSIEIEQLKEK